MTTTNKGNFSNKDIDYADHSEFVKYTSDFNEWPALEYELQQALGTCTVVLKEAYKISTPQTQLKFEKKVARREMHVNRSFVDVRSLKETSVYKIVKEGFDFPSNGLVFNSGYMHMDKNQHFQGKDYEVILCKIATGKSMSIPVKTKKRGGEAAKGPNSIISNDELDINITRADLDPNFDSLCLQNEQDASNSVYHYKYIVYEDDQVLPEYVLKFTFDHSKETNLKLPSCDGKNCNANAAYYCVNDDAYLCSSCNEVYHSKEFRLVKDHDVRKLEDRPKDFGHCNFHEGTPYTFICQTCRTPICIYCKVNGSHAEGDNAKHTLIKIQEAYKQAVSEARESDSALDKHKALLRNQQKTIDEKIAAVNHNAKDVENQIYIILENALETLQRHTQFKLNVLQADQIELRRRYDEVQWAECFQRYQLDVLDAHQYLRSWSRHCNFKFEAINARQVDITQVKPDINLKDARVIVTTDEDTVGMKNKNRLQKGQAADAVRHNDFLMDFNDTSAPRFDSPNKSNVEPLAYSNAPENNADSTSKLFGLTQEGPSNTLTTWRKRFLGGGYDSISGKNNQGGERTMLNTADSFYHESHARMERQKLKFDENAVASHTSKIFPSSDILKKSMEKKLLYYSLPFDDFLCEPQLAFKSKDETEVLTPKKIFKITEEMPYPSLILIQIQDKVFGGFCSVPWHKFMGPGGNEDCFLFSLSENIKLKPMVNENEKQLYVWRNTNSLSWGETDLVFRDDGEWTTEIENNYTTSKELKKSECKTFLAGKYKFRPDYIEVWVLRPIETK